MCFSVFLESVVLFRAFLIRSAFFTFMFILTSVVLFSLTDRHKLLFLVFYPIFAELGFRAARKDNYENKLRFFTWGLIALLYPLNFYLMAR